jgi:hypothetical protein
MCDWCEAKQPTACQDCGCLICKDIEFGDGDDYMRPLFVTTYGDVYCEPCGRRNQREIDRDEAEAFEWLDYDLDDDLDEG